MYKYYEMQQQRITIKTRSGKIIDRRAQVADLTDNRGKSYRVAQVGISAYKVDHKERGREVWVRA